MSLEAFFKAIMEEARWKVEVDPEAEEILWATPKKHKKGINYVALKGSTVEVSLEPIAEFRLVLRWPDFPRDPLTASKHLWKLLEEATLTFSDWCVHFGGIDKFRDADIDDWVKLMKTVKTWIGRLESGEFSHRTTGEEVLYGD